MQAVEVETREMSSTLSSASWRVRSVCAAVRVTSLTVLSPTIASLTPLQIPEDVDFRVMGTFTHLYYTLCGFVNYKLYHSSGLHYPPVFDRELEESGESLYAVILSSEDARGDAFGEDDESDSDDSMDAEEEEAAVRAVHSKHHAKHARCPSER